MEHGKPIFLHMEVLRVEEASKSEGRAVTCTGLVADWAFDQSRVVIQKSVESVGPLPLLIW
jgi:hypothetical protein